VRTLLIILDCIKELIAAVRKYFPKKTPAEKQSDTALQEQAEAELLKQAGRPKWD
jgi:hypothetical protein